MPAVQIRQGVDLGACLEQHPGDFHSVLRSLLTMAFDAVGGDVMKKRGPMHGRVEVRDTCRARPD